MEYIVEAYAKLNLTLDILRRREDGYHDLEMVMQSIALHDTITVTCGTGTGEILVESDCAALPSGPGNIAYRCAQVFFANSGIGCDGVHIHIQKRIPMEAGMAGGSTDGAAVLRGLGRHYGPDIALETLAQWGAQVGSDVPFCVVGGTKLAQGRGEILSPLPPMPGCYVCVCKPGFGLSTPALFGRVKTFSQAQRGHAMAQALDAGDLGRVAQEMGNDFVALLSPQEGGVIASIGDTMVRSGALGAMMTGSGPTVFGLFQEEGQAKAAQEILSQEGYFATVTIPVKGH